ncbi:hypothetical protein GMLC_04950 [Geomonas limicola]|uniref:Uncharacterized protein n=1 Tax=Geomonas limicola TaxID=2740186 RepID=A0A6V8N337_9BACT|nr:hypothetical protein GMLC_04950 [Geomonas limicola]
MLTCCVTVLFASRHAVRRLIAEKVSDGSVSNVEKPYMMMRYVGLSDSESPRGKRSAGDRGRGPASEPDNSPRTEPGAAKLAAKSRVRWYGYPVARAGPLPARREGT